MTRNLHFNQHWPKIPGYFSMKNTNAQK